MSESVIEPNADDILLPAEEIVLKSVESGVWADISGRPIGAAARSVRGSFLRRVLLGLQFVKDEGDPRPLRVCTPGVRIDGAVIVGPLDLADCAGVGGLGLPCLALVDCDIAEKVDFSDAHLTRLSISRSRIGEFLLRRAKIDGAFDFSNVRPAGDLDEGLAWIDAAGSAILGSVMGDGAILRVPKIDQIEVPPRDRRFALRLSNSLVDGSLSLSNAFKANGGVNLASAQIRGDLIGTGATMLAETADALFAESVRIEGRVSLDGLIANRCISMVNSKVLGIFDINRSKISNISTNGDSNALNLTGVHIGGDLTLFDGFEARGGVVLAGATIAGSLDFSYAILVNRTDDGGGDALYAANAEISGDVILCEVQAEGRVSFQSCKIGRDLNCDGARIKNRTDDGNGDAFSAVNAEVSGDLYMRGNFVAEGCVYLHSIKIDRDFLCGPAKLINRTTDGKSFAIAAMNMEVSGDVTLFSKFYAEGCVSFRGAKIAGNFQSSNADFKNQTLKRSGISLVAEYAEIGGGFMLSPRVRIQGRISMMGVKVAGSMKFREVHVSNFALNGEGEAIDATNAEIGGSVIFGRLFTSEGSVSLLGAKVGGNVQCIGARFRNYKQNSPARAVNLVNSNVGRSVILKGAQSIGEVSLLGCHVGRDLNCHGTRFVSWGSLPALQATNVVIGGNVSFDGATVLGRIILEHADIKGKIRWEGLSFPRELDLKIPILWRRKVRRLSARWSYGGRRRKIDIEGGQLGENAENYAAKLILAHATIGASLQAYDLTAEVPLLIDLSAARAYTLDDDKWCGDLTVDKKFPDGWGGDASVGKVTPTIDLDGFVYERIEHCDRNSAALRLRWLQRQHKSYDRQFFPQPYRQLASVFRKQGHYAAARRVMIASEDAAPSSFMGSFWHFLFGVLFGYGLSPWRASRTIASLFLIVWIFVRVASGHSLIIGNLEWKSSGSVLVLTPERALALGFEQSRRDVHPNVTEFQCGGDEIIPYLYALDMMLPIVPLHQEDRCELAARPGMIPWELAWSLFSIIGKICVSLALVTYSGVLKLKDD